MSVDSIETLVGFPSPDSIERAIGLLRERPAQQSQQYREYSTKTASAFKLLAYYLSLLNIPSVPLQNLTLLNDIQNVLIDMALIDMADTHPSGEKDFRALIIIQESIKHNPSLWTRSPELIQRVIHTFVKFLDVYNDFSDADRTQTIETILTRVFDCLRCLVESGRENTVRVLMDFLNRFFNFVDSNRTSDQIRINYMKTLSLVVDQLPERDFQLALYMIELWLSRSPQISQALQQKVLDLRKLLHRTNVPWVTIWYLRVLRNEEQPLHFRDHVLSSLVVLFSNDLRHPVTFGGKTLSKIAFWGPTFTSVLDIPSLQTFEGTFIREMKNHESEMRFLCRYPDFETKLQRFLLSILLHSDKKKCTKDIQNAFLVYMATLPEESPVPEELKKVFEKYFLPIREFNQLHIRDHAKVKSWFASFFPPKTDKTKVFEYMLEHNVSPTVLTKSIAEKYAKWRKSRQKKKTKQTTQIRLETKRIQQTRQLRSFRQHLKNVIDTILESVPEYTLIDPVTRQIPEDAVIVEATPLKGGHPLHFLMDRTTIPNGRRQWDADAGRAPLRQNSQIRRATFRVRILDDHEIPDPYKNVLRVLTTRRQRIGQLAQIDEDALTDVDKEDLEDEYAAIGQSLADRLQISNPHVLREVSHGLQTIMPSGEQGRDILATLPRRDGQDDEWTEARRRVVGYWLPILDRLVDDLTRTLPPQTPILLVDTMNALRKIFRQTRQKISYDTATQQDTDQMNRDLRTMIQNLRSKPVQQSYLNAPRIFVATQIVPPYPRKMPQIEEPSSSSTGVIQRVIRIPIRRKDAVKAAIPVLSFDRSMDDLVLFVLASLLKKRGYRPVIVSNDKFRDWGGYPTDQIRKVNEMYPLSRRGDTQSASLSSRRAESKIGVGRGGSLQQKSSSKVQTPTPAQAYGGGRPRSSTPPNAPPNADFHTGSVSGRSSRRSSSSTSSTSSFARGGGKLSKSKK